MVRVAVCCNGLSHPRRRSPFCFIATAILLGGCGETGPELAPVTGRITLDGKPLQSASVTFQPDDMKPPSFGGTDADGRYELMRKRGIVGALVGQHTVRITVSRAVVANPRRIPERYNSASDLRREVKAGENNEFNFELTSDK
jgi:hypothetical protein